MKRLVLPVALLFGQLAAAQSPKLPPPQTVDGVTVRVVDVDPARVLSMRHSGGDTLAIDGTFFTVEIEVSAKGGGKKYDYLSWGDTRSSDGAVVKDDIGNLYRRVYPSGQQRLAGATFYETLYDGAKVRDLIVLQPPVKDAKALTLAMPGSRVGVKGEFEFTIEAAAWAPKPKPPAKVTASTARTPPVAAEPTAATEPASAEITDEERAKAKEGARILGMSIGVFVLVAVVSVAFQMIPFMVALVRGHNSALAIGAICFFLGWTCVGWIVALIWSLTGDTTGHDRRRARYRDD